MITNRYWLNCFPVPPTKAVILDEKGSIVQGTIGPFNELSTLILTCDVIGGKTKLLPQTAGGLYP